MTSSRKSASCREFHIAMMFQELRIFVNRHLEASVSTKNKVTSDSPTHLFVRWSRVCDSHMSVKAISANDAREELYAIMREDSTFEDKAQAVLELGRRYLGVENGHLTRIDRRTDHWETLQSTDSIDGQFPPGLELELGTTFCRKTIESEVPLTFHDAPVQGLGDDPAFIEHGIHAYHGTTLVVDNEPYGTICFVEEDARDAPFTAEETMFIELLTRVLEHELERDFLQAKLTRQSNLATVLNRVLRHNLRNDMSVIRGYTQMMKDALDDETYPDKALRNIDDLLALSEKARELEQIVGDSYDRHQTDIGSLVERVVRRCEEDYPTASFSLQTGDDIDAAILPTFERAVAEIIENAAKHSGPSPVVEIAVERIPNAVEIQIADDGPGLDEQEREVLSTGIETPLIHGSGLGLWIVHWIITTHGGTVDTVVTDEGTEMTIRIPHGPEFGDDQHATDLRRARDLYEATFTEALDAMLIFNDEGLIVNANPAAEAIYGLSPKELLGRSIPKFLPDDFDFVTAWEDFQQDGVDRAEVTIVSADGTERKVENAASADVIPGQHFMAVREIAAG